MSIGARQWTRRQFSQTLAASAALSFVGRSAHALSRRGLAGYAFVGAGDAVHVFKVKGPHWRSVQTLSAEAPVHLEAHPSLPVLYAVHGVALWQNLPRGAVSAYRFSASSGHLTWIGTQPLSLSATLPRHAVVSPDGRHLLVSAEQGGIYNLLPIFTDGSLGQPVAIRKEHGREGATGKTAAPRNAVFHPDGKTLFTADAGLESVSVFAPGSDSIGLRHRVRSHEGAGPSQIVLSDSGEQVYALHAAEGSIAVHPLSGGHLSGAMQTFPAQQPGGAVMAMHPEGRFLVTASADAVTSLRVEPVSGLLSAVAGPVRCPLQSLAFGGARLLGTDVFGKILSLPFDGVSGGIGGPEIVAEVEGASFVLFRESLG